MNLDLAAMPVFEPDRSITGERLSFSDPRSGALESATSMGGPLTSSRPTRTLENGELAARLFRRLGGCEVALHAYRGFTKQPRAFNPIANMPTYSRLNSFGASVGGAVAGGIAHVETSLYKGDDDTGDDPNTPNSEFRGLVGYERELALNLAGGVQYYFEHILDHDRLLAAYPNPTFEPSETRHLITGRLTCRLLQQTLTASALEVRIPQRSGRAFETFGVLRVERRAYRRGGCKRHAGRRCHLLRAARGGGRTLTSGRGTASEVSCRGGANPGRGEIP